MKKKFFFLFILSSLSILTVSSQPFNAGNVVVLRVGDGSIPFDTKAYPVFLDEYTPVGSLVRSIAMPTMVNGSNNRFTLPPITGIGENTGVTIGYLTLSPDSKYLAAVGYNGPVGTDNSQYYDGADPAISDRIVAIVDHNGSINTSTKLDNNGAGFSLAYSAVTSNGTDIWTSFLGKGVYYTSIGSSTYAPVRVNTGGFYRVGSVNDGQLYYSTNSNLVYKMGTGLPQSTVTSATPLPGLTSSSGMLQNSGQFFFADMNSAIPGIDVLYIAANNQLALKKYSFDGASWIINGTIGDDSDDYTGLTGVVNGSSVTLFSTRKLGDGSNLAGGGELVMLTDNTGYTLAPNSFTGTPVVLATAATNTAFRGVAMAPFLASAPAVSIRAKIFLQGVYSSSLGRHKDVAPAWSAVLNAHALNQPFAGAPFNYSGTESVPSGFFTSTAATSDIVDWILLELRDPTVPSTLVATKAAFVREDGMIVGMDGVSNPSFAGVPAGNYHLVVRHRNHLAIRTSSPVAVDISPALYDFTTGQSMAFQDGGITTNAAMASLTDGVFGLWGGDANGNNNIRFEGLENDSDALLVAALLGNQALVLKDVYNKADLNLDGSVRYTGLQNDAGVIIKALASNQSAVVNQHQ